MDDDIWWKAPFVVWVSSKYEGWTPMGCKTLSEAIALGRDFEQRVGSKYIVTAGALVESEDM